MVVILEGILGYIIVETFNLEFATPDALKRSLESVGANSYHDFIFTIRFINLTYHMYKKN